MEFETYLWLETLKSRTSLQYFMHDDEQGNNIPQKGEDFGEKVKDLAVEVSKI